MLITIYKSTTLEVVAKVLEFPLISCKEYLKVD